MRQEIKAKVVTVTFLPEESSSEVEEERGPEISTPKVKPEITTPKVKPEITTPKVKPEVTTPEVKPEETTPEVKLEVTTPEVNVKVTTPEVKPEEATTPKTVEERREMDEKEIAARIPLVKVSIIFFLLDLKYNWSKTCCPQSEVNYHNNICLLLWARIT